MTQDDKRLKEIKREKWLLCENIKQEKKKLIELTNEEKMINGYHKVVRAKQKYRSKGKVKVRK